MPTGFINLSATSNGSGLRDVPQGRNAWACSITRAAQFGTNTMQLYDAGSKRAIRPASLSRISTIINRLLAWKYLNLSSFCILCVIISCLNCAIFVLCAFVTYSLLNTGILEYFNRLRLPKKKSNRNRTTDTNKQVSFCPPLQFWWSRYVKTRVFSGSHLIMHRTIGLTGTIGPTPNPITLVR